VSSPAASYVLLLLLLLLLSLFVAPLASMAALRDVLT
jgi:hypothetical protein